MVFLDSQKPAPKYESAKREREKTASVAHVLSPMKDLRERGESLLALHGKPSFYAPSAERGADHARAQSDLSRSPTALG